MKRTLLIFVAVLGSIGCSDDPKPAPTRTELLTGGGEKSWYITSVVGDELCGSASDDSWIFFLNGTFEYNHGEVTEDNENLCSDFVNLTGTWEFNDDETELTVTAEEEKGNPTNVFDVTMLYGSITTLTADKLVVEFSDGGDNRRIEFARR